MAGEQGPVGPEASSKTNNKKVLIIVGSIVGGLILLGIISAMVVGYFISKAAESVIETATGSQIDVNSDGSGEVTIKGDDGDEMKIASETEIPDGFPDAVPLYQDAKVLNAQTTTITDEGAHYSIILETADSLSQVDDFYKGALSTENGWNTMSRSASGEHVQIMSSNESQNLMLILGVQVDSETGKTQITVITRNSSEE